MPDLHLCTAIWVQFHAGLQYCEYGLDDTEALTDDQAVQNWFGAFGPVGSESLELVCNRLRGMQSVYDDSIGLISTSGASLIKCCWE
jgi:hypothetical protein